ncbi:MAG: SRPBCC family protein [Candidatus Thorarchaeota archaeon]|jgi:uncharacterized protein YndB with AHSA1/START domain
MTELIDVEVKQTTLVRAKPEDVYDALTTGEGLDAWFTVGSEVDARPGGSITFRWKDWKGPVLEAQRPERFVFQWYSDKPTYATTIEINFEEVEEGTVVRLREYGYHDTPSGRAALLECAAGWGEALTLLKYYVEHGVTY